MSRRMTEAVTADWHLCPGAWKKNPEVRGDSYYALGQITRFTIENRLNLMAGGDLFDQILPDSMSLHVAKTEIKRVLDNGLKVLFVQGQHEMADPPYLKVLDERTDHVHDDHFTLGGSEVAYALDYMTPSAFLEKMEACKNGPHADYVLFTHQVWKDFVVWRHNAPVFSDTPFATIITGDFHQHINKTLQRPGSLQQVISPGSTCMQALDEEPQKKFFVRYDDGSFESVPLKCRPFHHLDLLGPEALEYAIQNVAQYCHRPNDLPAEIQRPVVRVRFADNIPEAYERILAAFASVHLFAEPIKTEGEAVDKARDEGTDHAVQTCLARLRPPDTLVYRDLARVLGSADPGKEIEKVAKEFQLPEEVPGAS